MECHCHGGRQLEKGALRDCAIDLVTFLATLPFVPLYGMTCVAIMVLQMPTETAVLYGEEKQFL